MSKDDLLQSAEVEIAKDVIYILAALIIIVVIGSVLLMFRISHSLDGSIYYTLSSLADVNDEGYATIVLASVMPYGAAFYEIVGALIIDGIVKVVIIGLIVALLIKTLAGVDIGLKINSLKSRRLEGHTIICGYSGLGERLCEELLEKGNKFVIIEKEPAKLEEITDKGYLSMEGDFTDIKTLEKANAMKAAAIVFCGDKDFVNLMGILAARKLSKEINIISRARDEHTVVKMQRAGADLCIIPELVAGLELGRKISGI